MRGTHTKGSNLKPPWKCFVGTSSYIVNIINKIPLFEYILLCGYSTCMFYNCTCVVRNEIFETISSTCVHSISWRLVARSLSVTTSLPSTISCADSWFPHLEGTKLE